MARHLFTSESVTEGHPDKLCDQVSDAILDALIEKDPKSRVACETTATTGLILVAGEISTNAYVDIPKIVRETVEGIGYVRGKFGFDSKPSSTPIAMSFDCSSIAVITAQFSASKPNLPLTYPIPSTVSLTIFGIST